MLYLYFKIIIRVNTMPPHYEIKKQNRQVYYKDIRSRT
jgi:hypothetical protein